MNSAGLVTVSYIAATILFILALGGLSNQETARRGNWYGIIGMAIALLATILGVVTQHYTILMLALLIGGSIGLVLARRVKMTQMPELVAILHSLVGLAAVLVGFANFMDHSTAFAGVELTIHNIETYLGILIGAVTFSGSVIAWRGTDRTGDDSEVFVYDSDGMQQISPLDGSHDDGGLLGLHRRHAVVAVMPAASRVAVVAPARIMLSVTRSTTS